MGKFNKAVLHMIRGATIGLRDHDILNILIQQSASQDLDKELVAKPLVTKQIRAEVASLYEALQQHETDLDEICKHSSKLLETLLRNGLGPQVPFDIRATERLAEQLSGAKKKRKPSIAY